MTKKRPHHLHLPNEIGTPKISKASETFNSKFPV